MQSECNFEKRNLWHSRSNIGFYESLSPEGLMKASESIGLDTCCDLKLIEPYINRSTSILEIGSGYGRVLNYVTKNGYTGELYAIERSGVFYDFLKNKISPKINLVKGDIVECSFKRKFDLILWLWAGFIEFSIEEQKTLFSKLASLLNKNGIAIIDVIPTSFKPPRSKLIDQQHYIVHLPQTRASCYCYVPSIYDFSYYAALASLEYDQSQLYVTPKNRQRILHFFIKEKGCDVNKVR